MVRLHASIQGTLAREHVSTEGMLAREHDLNLQSTYMEEH